MADDDDWTPRPGEALPAEESAALQERFEGRFRVNTAGRHPKVPTWSTFDPADSRRAGPEALEALAAERGVLLLFAGSGRELRRTTMGEVRRYVAALEPWEDDDLYVLDDTMTWCLALTHAQMGNERLIIVAGAFPPPR